MQNDKEKLDETNEMSDYLKELLKPENLVGPFKTTEEMMKSLWDED